MAYPDNLKVVSSYSFQIYGENSGVSATVAVASIKKIYVTLIYTSDFRYLFHIKLVHFL